MLQPPADVDLALTLSNVSATLDKDITGNQGYRAGINLTKKF